MVSTEESQMTKAIAEVNVGALWLGFVGVFNISLVLLYNIRTTQLCSFYPLEPHFYIVKLGFAGVFNISLVLF